MAGNDFSFFQVDHHDTAITPIGQIRHISAGYRRAKVLAIVVDVDVDVEAAVEGVAHVQGRRRRVVREDQRFIVRATSANHRTADSTCRAERCTKCAIRTNIDDRQAAWVDHERRIARTN